METFLIAARTLHFAATMSLTGIYAWECLVASPALVRTGAAAAIPARLNRRLAWLSWTSLALAVLSGAAWLAAVAAEMSGKPLSGVLLQGAWVIVLTRTRFGTDWLVRLGFAALVACCLLAHRRRGAGARRAVSWTALMLAALMLATLAWAGHGGATPGRPGDLHLAADILHLLAAGVWLGTLAPFVLLLAEARRAGNPSWAAIVRAVTRRFSALAVASVGVLLAAGLVNTWFLAGTVPALVGTAYGRLLLAKIALFAAMLMIAAVNLLRLTPRLGDPAVGNIAWRTVARLQRNALIEATIGLAVLAIVGVLGIMPPGLHSEPGWPFAYRIDLAALTVGETILFGFVTVTFCVCAVAAVAAAAAGYYRGMAGFVGGIVLCLVAVWIPLRPAVERAYPTSFYTSAEPYAAASVDRGAALYAEYCALCHGATGRGDGPAAVGLRIRPANLTEPHLFTHTPGDLFWWVSNGRGDGAMPGFADVMTPGHRWDVINFIRARAAGILTQGIGPQIATAAAPQIPDFPFETAGAQQTLSQTLSSGPVLLVLFVPPAPLARLAALASMQPRLTQAGLYVVAIEIGARAGEQEQPGPAPSHLVAGVSPDVAAALTLFQASRDGGETELLLDRGGYVRARWTVGGPDGLADVATLSVETKRVAQVAVAAPSHAGHAH